MNILFIATEAAPYYRTGGLSDIVYGLAKELCVQGHDTRIVVPRYRTYAKAPCLKPIPGPVKVALGSYSRYADVLKGGSDPVAYFIDQNFYFGRDDLYGYADDYERFIFFTRAALDMLVAPGFREAENGWFPDIIQGFDWAAGFIPGWLPEYRKADARFNALRFTLFVHNLGRLGKYTHRTLLLANQAANGIYPEIGEDAEKISFLGRGAFFADRLITANPDFDTADNPLPESAQALRPVLDARRSDGTLHGIISKIDPAQWDPSHDSALARPFSDTSIEARIENKLALQAHLRLEQDRNVPLLGVVSRLIPENGFELLRAVERHRAELGQFQLAIVAERGDPDYQKTVAEWEASQDNQQPWVRSRLLFDDNLARLIYAGCDIFLLPAKEHPGGITQLVAMRYGALPVARRTGTLAKTVAPYEPGMAFWREVPQSMGIGFTFDDFSEESFLAALKTALATYRQEGPLWRRMQLHNMRAAFNWAIPAAEYLDVYSRALAAPPREITAGAPQALTRNSRQVHAFHDLANLPYAGSLSDTLSEAAGLIRWVLCCDAVYVSALKRSAQLSAGDSGSRKIERLGSSFAAARAHPAPDPADVAALLNQSGNNTWRRLGDSDVDGICRPIRDLGALASGQGWNCGWSAPVIVQGRLFGWIDAFFATPSLDITWVRSSLTSLAGALGLRLDTIRIMTEAETVSALGLDFVGAQSAQEAMECACRWTKALIPGSGAWVFPVRAGELAAPASAGISGSASMKLAQRALKSNQASYVPDWNDAPRDPDGHRQFRSVLTVPVAAAAGGPNIDAVLMVASPERRAFTRDDENLLVHHIAPNLAAALQKARRVESEDQRRVSRLRILVGSLVAGVEFDELLERTVETVGSVLEVRAGALYLRNDQTGALELRAACGYQRGFLGKPVAYRAGEGLTGWIAEHGELLKFDSLAELHAHPAWKGAYNREYGVPEPNAFLGIPLIVQGSDGSTKVIGVLKLEDRKESQPRPFFDEADVHLAEMSANIIATVVYNAQRGDRRLRDFSENLGQLSDALAGSRDRDTLMRNIVDKILDVLHVDAASLYLADESGTELVIQAAAGYQAPLVDRKVKYKWGQGVTGTIAAKREPVVAQSLDELRRIGGAKSGTFDEYHEGRLQPQSFYGLPLVVSEKPQAIGVLKVESTKQRFFSGEDRLLIRMMANVIATVVYNAQQSERRLSDFSISLRELSGVLAGSRDRDTLMRNIVDKILDVLHVDAASLYLADESGTELVIQAAAGYQAPLVERKVKYKWGQGVTGAIAASREPVVAQSLEELRRIGGAKSGTYDSYHDGRLQPQSFYGLPLVVSEKPQAIGVLKVESTKQRFFSIEDRLLIGMMANVIATVVYNAQQSERRLNDFSVSLAALSSVLAGGRDMSTLMDNIVEKIADVLHVDAASLYLADESGTELTIQAAAGYQKPLVERQVKYKWGQGVTGTIAANRKPVVALSLEELRNIGGASSGTYDQFHTDKLQPQSFYGLPLVVSPQEQAMGVLKVESTKQRFFSSEDRLLIEVMANVIATVIYNARRSDKHLGSVLQFLGSLSAPRNAAGELLAHFARSGDSGVTAQLAGSVAAILDDAPGKIMAEAKALFEIRANRALYAQVAGRAKQEQVRWHFSLFDAIVDTHPELDKWCELMEAAEPWLALYRSCGDAEAFGEESRRLARMLAGAVRVASEYDGIDPSGTWYGAVFGAEKLFGDENRSIPVLFQRHGDLDEDNQVRLLAFLRNELKRPYPLAVLVLWNQRVTPEQIQRVRQQMSIHAVDIVVATTADLLRIQRSPSPPEAFRKLVIRQATTQSPFILDGPVPDAMFFGREREIREIMQYVGSSRSCVVIGGRRYGKTSILWRLHRTSLPEAGFRSVFCAVGGVREPKEFFDKPVNGFPGEASPGRTATIGDLLEGQPPGKPVVLLLDEADKLVEIDRQNGWLMSSRLRAAASSGLRVVLSGERVLQEALQDPGSPLLNFGSALLVGPLELPAVRKLITGPFGQLEVELRDAEAVVRQIYEFTSGHPNIVQRIGRRLVQVVNPRKARYVALSDLRDVIEDPTFQREDFLNVYWEWATPLEKLISLLMAEDPSVRKLQNVIAALAARCGLTVGASEVDEALRHLLELRQILRLKPTGYEFAVEAFPRVVAGTIASNDLLLVIADKYRIEKGAPNRARL